MNYFFGFNTDLANNIDWMFNLNHIFLLLFGAFIVLSLLFGLHANNEKGKKIEKITIAVIMLVLEVGRTAWYYAKHIYEGGTFASFDWWWRISFQMCALMTWLTILTLILSAILDKNNKILIILKNILFGAALVGGFLTYVYPDFITESKPLLHFVNIQTILVHALLVFVPLYFIKNKELEIRLKNIWMPALGFLYVGSVAMSASQISEHNFAFALRTGLLNDIGINLDFPYHYPFTFIIVFMITFILYGSFELKYRLKNKKIEKQKTPIYNKNIFVLNLVTLILSGLQNFLLLLFIPSLFETSPINTWIGLICLLPIILAVIMLIVSTKLTKIYKDKNNTLLKSKDNILYIVLLFLSNPILGSWYFISYLKK